MNTDTNTTFIIDKIIKIQTLYRKYRFRKQTLIPSSFYQTKQWRQNRKWYKNGKSNECEKYQINLIEKLIKFKLNKTTERINIESNEIIENKNPMNRNDGYEWTENFDGKIIKNDIVYYFNLKFVCDCGGAQTRTLREVYHFIKYQMEYLLKYNTKNVYFINILDGDTSYNNMSKFIFLVNKSKYTHTVQYIFIGSLYEFQKSGMMLLLS
jgi:hypothetical protein